MFQFMGFSVVFAYLEAAMLDACSAESEWPAQVAAGIYAGVDYAVANPEMAEMLASDGSASPSGRKRYESVVGRLAGFLRAIAPQENRLPGATDETLVAGMVGLVGDHLRVGRMDRLLELRPELVLLALLPYMGFAEAQDWANRIDRSNPAT